MYTCRTFQGAENWPEKEWMVSNQFLWNMTTPLLCKPLGAKCFKATWFKDTHDDKAWFLFEIETYFMAVAQIEHAKSFKTTLSRWWRFRGRRTALTTSWRRPTWRWRGAAEVAMEDQHPVSQLPPQNARWDIFTFTFGNQSDLAVILPFPGQQITIVTELLEQKWNATKIL